MHADIPAGSLNYAIELRHALTRALKDSPLSRYQIAARMSELLGVEVSKTMLDAFTAETRGKWRFPFEYAAAFDVACETNILLDLLARKQGCRVLPPREQLDAELGRIRRQQAELGERERAILAAAAVQENAR